ncbi:MAG: O-antigen ligase family protein, partial [Terracidiphilus sp.]
SSKVAWLLGIGIGACLLLLVVGEDLFPALQQGVLLGRTDSQDSSFNGRLPVWKECLVSAARQPLQGYGYGSFFTPSRLAEISARQGWGVGAGHSAYLELILGTGVVGLISFMLIMVVGIKRALETYKVSLSPFDACFVAILAFTLLHGVLESTVVTAGMFSFVIMVIVAQLGFAVPPGLQSPDPLRKG